MAGDSDTTAFDAADYLETPAHVAAYLKDAFEDGDATEIATALGVVARSKGIAGIARDAGVTRDALYKALSPEGNPNLKTLLGVMSAMNLKLSVETA